MKWVISKRDIDASDFVIIETFDDGKGDNDLDVVAANAKFETYLAEDTSATYQMQPLG